MYTNLHLHTLGLLQFNIANSTCLMTSRFPDWNASTTSPFPPFPNLGRPRLISLRTLLLYVPSLNQGTLYGRNTWHSHESGPAHIPKTPMRDMHDNSHSHSYGTTGMAVYWSHQSKVEEVDTNLLYWPDHATTGTVHTGHPTESHIRDLTQQILWVSQAMLQ